MRQLGSDRIKGRPPVVHRAVVGDDLEALRYYGKRGAEAAKESRARKATEVAAKKEAAKAPNTSGMKDAPKPDPVRFQEELDKRYP